MNSPSRLKDLFFEARSLPAPGREAFLQQIASTDGAAAARLRSMLEAELKAGPLDPPARDPGLLVAGRYKITRVIQATSLSRVYLAADTRLHGRPVVVKFPDISGNRDWMLQRFHEESQALAGLTHPNVVRIYDSGMSEGEPFLVMEYIEGVSLREALGGGPLPTRRAMDIASGVAAALDATHRRGILHLDIKPENIMLRNTAGGGQPVLIDFGIARQVRPPMGAAEDPVAGSRAYMSPEQLAGSPVPQSDVYSLGIVTAEMLSGRREFREHAFLRRSTDPDPARRFQSAGEFTAAFGSFAKRPRRIVFGAVAACALAALAGLAPFIRPTPDPEIQVVVSVPGREERPSASRDGRRVFFSATGGDQWDVYMIEPGAVEAKKLTDSPEREYSAVGSPDGESIAFIGTGGGKVRLAVQQAVPGATQRELLMKAGLQRISWHPGGKWIVAAANSAGADAPGIFALPLGGGGWHRVTTPPAGLRDNTPAVSPDGRWLAFTRGAEPRRGRLMITAITPDMQATGEPRLLAGQSTVTQPSWSPAGDGIYYTTGDMNSSIWRVNATGPAEPRQIRLPDGRYGEPFATPRGLLLIRRRTNRDLWRWDRDAPGGGASRSIIETDGDDTGAQYSPDGRWISHVSVSDRSDLWLADAGRLTTRRITAFGDVLRAAWNPDSLRLLVVRRSVLSLVSVPSGALESDWKFPAGFDPAGSRPVFSADAQWIYYVAPGEAGGRIVRIRTGQERGEAAGPAGVSQVVPIPGSARLVLRLANGSLVEWDPASGSQERLASDSSRDLLHASPGGIYYTAYSVLTGGRFYFQPYRGDRRELFRETTDVIGQSLSASPDGRYLVYSRPQREQGELVIVPGIR